MRQYCDFDKDLRQCRILIKIPTKMRQRAASYGASYLRKCRIFIKIPTKCAKGPQVMAQLLAAMSDFDKDSNKAASYSAITCGNGRF